jgi:small subunit ribosomal protein S21
MSVTLTAVKKRDNEDINSLLKRFKRKVESSGHLIELRERRYFVKPSMVKRIQKNDILFKRKVEKILEEERLIKAKSRI